MKSAFILLIMACSHPLLSQQSGHIREQLLRTISSDTPDTVAVRANVKSIYKCPPCPPNARCKPCVDAHLVVGDQESDPWTVYTRTTQPFIIGKTYRFTLLLKNKSRREAVVIAASPVP
jgi:hypothetical protein